MIVFEKQRYRLTGATALLQHNGQLADPLNSYAKELAKYTGKRKKSDLDHQMIALWEWRGGLYLDDELRVCVPGENIEAMIKEAAKLESKGKTVLPALFVPGLNRLEYEGPQEYQELEEAREQYWLRSIVRVGSARVARTRPMFRKWAVEFNVHYKPALINETKVYDWLETSGMQIGLMDGRPRYGQFGVERV